MTPRKGKKFRRSEAVEDLRVTHAHAAGIDVHSAVHFVAVPVADVPQGFINPEAKLPAGVRKFGTNTGDLEAIAAWLKDCGVKTIAMESTGVYWIPLFELLASQRDKGAIQGSFAKRALDHTNPVRTNSMRG